MPIALLAALAGSLALHAAALFMPDVDLSTTPEPPPIVAELRPPPPAPAPEVKKAAEPHPARHHPAHHPRTAKGTALPASQLEAAPAAVAAAPEAQPEAAPEMPAEAQPEPQPEAPPAKPVEPVLPSRGYIRYTVYRGDRGFVVGRAEHSWEFADGRYRLTSVTETTGLAALFKPVSVELESRGRLTAGGLQPERFTTRRNGAETQENADFDWENHRVTLKRDGSQHAVLDGAQDLLSFHYQLAYLAGLAMGADMGVATGKKFERYHFDSLGEEKIDTPAGPFRTLHVRVKTDSTTELWLALDRRLLPVKIRYTDRKGESFEQVAIEIGM